MSPDGARDVPGTTNRGIWLRRVAWMIGLWSASVLALAVVAYVLRGIMAWAGLAA